MEETRRRWTDSIVKIKDRLHAEGFSQRHRRQDKDFTRERILTFPVVMLLLLQKTTRSIQRHAHSFLRQLWPESGALSVTPGGWTQARAKLRHTAFIELNEQILLPEFYSVSQAQHCQRWRGFRLLGMDGSTLRLPAHPEIAREFGVHQGTNQRGGTGRDYTVARFSVLYDLLNDLGLGAELAPQTTSELVAARAQRPELRALNLPEEMEVRFVSVRLPNGELEVLATSLLDETRYPTGEFLEVYHWRWNHETYHQRLKSRLDLENWTGQTLEAVLQDVQAAVFVSNLESLLSQEVQEELAQGDAQRQYPLQVNRSVSFHALKEHLLDLLYSQTPIESAITEIQTWMRRNPVSVRERKTPRPPPSFPRSYNYQRNLKKSVF